MSNVIKMPRYGQAGYYSVADLPQRPPIGDSRYSAGWPEMDELLWLYPGQFIVTTGVAGSGKSTFWLNVICNIAEQSYRSSFMYVPENELYVRDKLTRIWGVRRGLDRFLAEKCFIQSAMPEYYGQEPKTLEWVLDKAVLALEKDAVSFILLDPWNEIERAKPKDMLMTDYVGQCLMYMKQFVRAYDATLCLVAHPTKEGVKDGKVPRLSDIEQSMNWYNKCDNGLIVVRETTATKVISAKVRERPVAGREGSCWFSVDEQSEQFTPQFAQAQ